MNARLSAGLLLLAGVAPSAAQSAPRHATVVYAVGREPTMPIPLFTSMFSENEDLADQIFLHLAVFKPGAQVTGDNALAPALAKSWHRTDPLTLVFDLDRRARWQDGTPVSAHDVVYTWQLANKTATDQSRLEPIASVEAVDQWTVRVRFKRPFLEQLYIFAFLMQPLPAHLLERLPADGIITSDFAKHPIGNGPFRFDHRVAGQLVELRADTAFFLGRPSIDRVIFRFVTDANTRVNLFLTGETDVLDHIPGAALAQVREHAESRLVNVPASDLVYLLFNTRARTDSGKTHPIFSDPRVREALTLALDRPVIARATYGEDTPVPDAAQSQIWGWITPGGIKATPVNVARARALLAQAGWRDADGDGVLDKNGAPLHFTVMYVSSSAARHAIALQAQQMWRAVGVQADLDRIEGSVMRGRVTTGQFDIWLNGVGQDPTPSSLVQSWSCESARAAGSTNYAHWCDSTFDHLIAAATVAKDQPAAWRSVLTRMASQHPAIFVASPSNAVAVHRRYDNVTIWPSRAWLSLWQWRVRPEAALLRDR
jgi:peptide/nickel transport system substrate-binding protein